MNYKATCIYDDMTVVIEDDVCKHGVDDGACKECYMEAQEK